MGHLVVFNPAIENAKYPHLEAAIRYWGFTVPRRWSDAVVSASRDGHFAALQCDRWTPPEWEEHLDQLESLLRTHQGALMALPRPKRLPPPAPASHEDVSKRRPPRKH